MKTLERQLADYGDQQREQHPPITVAELNELVTVLTPVGRRPRHGWAVAASVGAAVLLVGLASLLLLDTETSVDPIDTPPSPPTTLVETTSTTATTEEESTPPVGFARVDWTYIDGSVDQAYRVIVLPEGGYAAVPLFVHLDPAYWYSSDGVDWEPWADVDPVFSENSVEWVVGEWAATWPAEGQTSADTKMTLWHYEANGWNAVLVSEDVYRWNQPAVDGDVVLISGLGNSQQFVWRSEDGQAEIETLPWHVPPPNSEGMTLHDVDILALPDGGFAAYVKEYDRPGQPGWLDPPVRIWTSSDGSEWEEYGTAPFANEQTLNASVYRLGDRLVVVYEQDPLPDNFAHSLDGLTWEDGIGLSLPTDDRIEPQELVTTAEGYLLYGQPFLLSTDNAQTWLRIPDHEDVDVPSTGYFSVGGIAGDLIYHSNEDGLWIGRPRT